LIKKQDLFIEDVKIIQELVRKIRDSTFTSEREY
jgi:hypothetical protein